MNIIIKLCITFTLVISASLTFAKPLEQKVHPQKILLSQNGGILSSVKPNYPKKAQRESIEGWVELTLEVDHDGKLSKVDVVAAEPKRIFENEAKKSLQNWRFKQKIVAGQAVPYQLTQTINFKLVDYTMENGASTND